MRLSRPFPGAAEGGGGSSSRRRRCLEVRVRGERDVLDRAAIASARGRARPRTPARAGRPGRRHCRRSGCAPRAGRRDQADPQRAPHREVVAEAAGQHQLAHASGPGTPATCCSMATPDAMAPLQSCTWRTSSWVSAISPRGAALARAGQDHQALLAAHLDARPEGRGQAVAALQVDEAGPVDARPGRAATATASSEPRAAESLGGRFPDGVQAQVAVLDADAIDGARPRRASRGGSARPPARARRAQSRPTGARASPAGPRRWCRCRPRCAARATRRGGWRGPPPPRRRPRSRPPAAAGRRAPPATA